MSFIRKASEDEPFDLSNYTIAKRYRLKYKLGEGAHGHVYFGNDTVTNKHIAIKVVRIHLNI